MGNETPEAVHALGPGTVVAGRYCIEKFMAEGAFGEVYLAKNIALGSTVVVKVLKTSYNNHSEVVRRFLKEPRAAASVQSEHVVKVFDSGTETEEVPDLSNPGATKTVIRFHFLVMEYLRGHDLATELEEKGRPDLSMVLHLTLAVCDGLHDVHELGIVHRDLKPENVFLVSARRGRPMVKIMDFGIAHARDESDSERSRLTRDGSSMGTPAYMAPEQWQNPTGVDHRADLYAVGVMLYELVEGVLPFDGATAEAAMFASAHNPPRNMMVADADIEAIVLRAIAVDPAQRFQSAGEMTKALEAYARSHSLLPQESVSQPPADAVEISRPVVAREPAVTNLAVSDIKSPPRQTRRGGVIAVGAAALLIATIAFATLGGHKPPTRVATATPTTQAAPPLTPVTPVNETAPATTVAAPEPTLAPAPEPTQPRRLADNGRRHGGRHRDNNAHAVVTQQTSCQRVHVSDETDGTPVYEWRPLGCTP